MMLPNYKITEISHFRTASESSGRFYEIHRLLNVTAVDDVYAFWRPPENCSLCIRGASLNRAPQLHRNVAMFRLLTFCYLDVLQVLISSYDHQLSADKKYLMFTLNLQKVSLAFQVFY